MPNLKITVEQEEMVVRLYLSQRLTIKQIIAESGVKSEQTIYRILDSRGVPRLKIRKPVRKISINLDMETDELIRQENPKNISSWVCEMVKKGVAISNG